MDWNLNPSEAIRLQKALSREVRIKPYIGPLDLIAGADVSFNRFSSTFHAGFVVLDFKSMQLVDSASASVEVTFPYIPGLLSFREIPPLLAAWEQLKTNPDVIMFDGQGIAHPRRLGIASHAGLTLDRPSLGCAKSLLTGKFLRPPRAARASTPLLDRATAEQIGWVLRTKFKVKPVFVSPGHRMDLNDALQITLACTRRHRIPEPTRLAHLYVNEVRRAFH